MPFVSSLAILYIFSVQNAVFFSSSLCFIPCQLHTSGKLFMLFYLETMYFSCRISEMMQWCVIFSRFLFFLLWTFILSFSSSEILSYTFHVLHAVVIFTPASKKCYSLTCPFIAHHAPHILILRKHSLPHLFSSLFFFFLQRPSLPPFLLQNLHNLASSLPRRRLLPN